MLRVLKNCALGWSAAKARDRINVLVVCKYAEDALDVPVKLLRLRISTALYKGFWVVRLILHGWALRLMLQFIFRIRKRWNLSWLR